MPSCRADQRRKTPALDFLAQAEMADPGRKAFAENNKPVFGGQTGAHSSS